MFYSNPWLRERDILACKLDKRTPFDKKPSDPKSIIIKPNLKFIWDLIEIIFGVDNFEERSTSEFVNFKYLVGQSPKELFTSRVQK